MVTGENKEKTGWTESTENRDGRDRMEVEDREETQEIQVSRESEGRRGSKDNKDSEEIRAHQVQTTPDQEPKENRGTLDYRDLLDRTDGQGRVEWSGSRVQMEEEERLVRRGFLEDQEPLESREPPVLQVLRVPEGSEVNLDREASLDFLVPREDQEHLERRGQSDDKELTDRRASQETQVIQVLQAPRDPEECRVRTVKTVTALQDLKE